MFKKIIFIHQTEFHNYDFKRFGVEFFLKKKIEIQLWDITQILSNLNFKRKRLKIIKTINFKKKISLENSIKKIDKHTIVIPIFDANSQTDFIFENLNKNNVVWGQYNFERYPQSKISLKNRILINLHNPIFFIKEKLSRMLRLILIKTKFKKIHIPHFEIITKNSSKNFSKSFPIFAHSWAYDDFLNLNKNKKSQNLNKKSYLLYIDENVPNHNDTLLAGYHKRLCEKKIFYREINKFFEFLETKYKAKVIIAGYPKTNHYQSKKNNFNNRKVIYGNTISLVKNSLIVLQHNSTAVNYSILFKKPIIFITSNNYLLHYQESIEALARTIGKIPINISSNYYEANSNHLQVDEKKYQIYFKRYIKDNNRNLKLTTYQAIYKNLPKIFNLRKFRKH